MKIGVYGSSAGEMQEEVAKKARKMGKAIAQHQAIVVTGGCPGIPQEAVLGAKEAGGKCIGFSPTVSLEAHQQLNYPTEGFSEFVFIPQDYPYANNLFICQKYRNLSSLASVDAAIFVSGRVGTMNEFTIAYDLGKVIGVLEGTGGITERAIKILLEDAKKKTGAEVIFDADPVKLPERVLAKLKSN